MILRQGRRRSDLRAGDLRPRLEYGPEGDWAATAHGRDLGYQSLIAYFPKLEAAIAVGTSSRRTRSSTRLTGRVRLQQGRLRRPTASRRAPSRRGRTTAGLGVRADSLSCKFDLCTWNPLVTPPMAGILTAGTSGRAPWGYRRVASRRRSAAAPLRLRPVTRGALLLVSYMPLANSRNSPQACQPAR